MKNSMCKLLALKAFVDVAETQGFPKRPAGWGDHFFCDPFGLIARLKNDLPLAAADRTIFYGGDREVYVD
ncbi:hypothetical protein D3C72_2296760 [compost metagenome]